MYYQTGLACTNPPEAPQSRERLGRRRESLDWASNPANKGFPTRSSIPVYAGTQTPCDQIQRRWKGWCLLWYSGVWVCPREVEWCSWEGPAAEKLVLASTIISKEPCVVTLWKFTLRMSWKFLGRAERMGQTHYGCWLSGVVSTDSSILRILCVLINN